MLLLFIMPAFAVAGAVKILDSSDVTKSLDWSRQQATVTLEVTDADLDVPIKKVLLPADVTDGSGTVATTAGSSTLTGTSSAFDTDFAVGDTIIVGTETVRAISAIASSTSLTVSKAFKNTGSGLTASEVNTAAGLAAACPDCALAESISTAAAAGVQFLSLDNIPVKDNGIGSAFANRFSGSTDTIVNRNDVRLVDSTGADVSDPTVVDLSGGGGVITANQSGASAVTAYAVYWGSGANDTGTSVKVTSNADPTGFTVALDETGPTSGVFRGSIKLSDSTASDSTASPPALIVGPNDIVTLKYSDASPSATITKTITVETTLPVFTNLSPAHDTAGQASRPEVFSDITDADSSVVKSSIRVIFARDDDADSDLESTVEVDVSADGDIFTITGGFQLKQRLPSANAPTSDSTVYWWVKATDTAGNLSVSDRQATISSVADACDAEAFAALSTLVGLDVSVSTDMKGCQPMAIKVDFTPPSLTASITGSNYDTAAKATITDVTKAKNTSIRLDFNESLDSATIAPSDFHVDGVAPSAADWYSGDKDSIFLTVPAMASSARPKVELVGEVKDVAGNPKTVGTISLSTDGIAPGLTVTVTGTGASRPVTKDKVTIQVVADEDVGTPNVTVWQVGGSAVASAGHTLGDLDSGTSVAMVLKSPRTYEGSFTASGAGLFNVYVSTSDATAGNVGSHGLDNVSANDQDTDKTLVQIALASGELFEVDTAVAAPDIRPTSTDDPDTFITIDFTDEGKEYGLGADDIFTTTIASVDDSYDEHGTVTITSASVGGTDITASLASTDNKIFLYKASGLAVAKHTVKVKAKDSAGNETEFSATVEIKAKALFEVKVNPGWNMVSIPGAPADADINAVIPATHPISTVLTYDPTLAGGWLTAVRGADGLFTGTLTTIDATMAYWVLTNSFESFKVNIPGIGAGTATLPPILSLVQGWNLVPVLDVTGTKTAGSDIDAASYFSGLKVSRVYNFDTVANLWIEVDITESTVAVTDDNVKVGTGYWVYLTADGTLVP